jgi:hypothetical protein
MQKNQFLFSFGLFELEVIGMFLGKQCQGIVGIKTIQGLRNTIESLRFNIEVLEVQYHQK